MIVVYDTETTGLVNMKLPVSHASQPHLVQLGILVLGDDGTERGMIDLIVKPDGYTIPKQASDVHGITQDIAETYGVPLQVAVGVFVNLRARASLLVGHNEEFDRFVMNVAIHRTGRTPSHPGPNRFYCTKNESTLLVNLPPTERMLRAGFNKPKAPTLTELTRFLFNEELEGAHSAIVDCRACARAYLELQRRRATA